MKIVLLVKNQAEKTSQELIFDKLPLLFGRSRICDVPLADPILSRQHCGLELRGDKVFLCDYESANGTTLNGKSVKEAAVDAGDHFQLGSFEISIEKLDMTPETMPELEELIEESVPTAPRQEKTKTKEKKGEVVSVAELTMKTPAMLSKKKGGTSYSTKDWVQMSLLWKGELVDIQCFDIGDVVTLGESVENDFVVSVPSLPRSFQFLKIKKTGVEIQLHPSMKGMVETRGQVRSLDDLRMSARPSELGMSTYVQFDERLLIEVGPFTIFIQSVRLNLSAPLTTPLISEPVFTGILSATAALALFFFIILRQVPSTAEESPVPEEIPAVKVELPTETPPPPPPPPPPPKPRTAESGPRASKKMDLKGDEGAGERAAGDAGRAGRTTGSVAVKARPIGVVSSNRPQVRQAPKGAFGEITKRDQAKQGRSRSSGVGSVKAKSNARETQAASKREAPQVNVEETGILGGLKNAEGGGGTAAGGGVLSGQGLGGEIEGSLEGLERGSDIDARGTGGRGDRGVGLGGGGTGITPGGLSTQGRGGGREGFGIGSSGRKGEAEVSYNVQDVVVRDGLTREEIKRVVDQHQHEIQACYEKASALAGNRNLGGRLVANWFVNRDGRAENIRQETGIGDDGALFQCVSNAIRSWQFPRPRGGSGAQVRWPWVFRQGT